MPELALDDVDGHPFPGKLDSVPVPELVGREPAPNTSLGGEPAQLTADGGGRPTRDRGSGRR